jgi:hypothetical protein
LPPAGLVLEIDVGERLPGGVRDREAFGASRRSTRAAGSDGAELRPNVSPSAPAEDVRTGKLDFTKSVDIRDNTDESWRRGLDYMLRHYLFGEP